MKRTLIVFSVAAALFALAGTAQASTNTGPCGYYQHSQNCYGNAYHYPTPSYKKQKQYPSYAHYYPQQYYYPSYSYYPSYYYPMYYYPSYSYYPQQYSYAYAYAGAGSYPYWGW